MENEVRCTLCHELVKNGRVTSFDGEQLCHACLEEHTVICDRCGERIWDDDAHSDSQRSVCQACYDRHYYHCTECDRLISQEDAYYFDDGDDPFCYACYCDQPKTINDYSYKPEPVFYSLGSCDRYMGIVLEIDDGGETSRKAEQILSVANVDSDHMYCKHDGSLENGFELVSHPMTICYHEKKMPWCNILAKAKALGYVSHQAGTCGLHIHVNRDAFGRSAADQEACIARVLYFFEKHWEELLKFSRRTERQLQRWANRYGLKENPKDILCEAKGKHTFNRYTCVNLTNDATIEFRMFRGTLKLNTLLATLQLIDRICDIAINLSDEVVKSMSWTTFVSGCTQKELVQYLKERRLYINEPVPTEEEV